MDNLKISCVASPEDYLEVYDPGGAGIVITVQENKESSRIALSHESMRLLRDNLTARLGETPTLPTPAVPEHVALRRDIVEIIVRLLAEKHGAQCRYAISIRSRAERLRNSEAYGIPNAKAAIEEEIQRLLKDADNFEACADEISRTLEYLSDMLKDAT